MTIYIVGDEGRLASVEISGGIQFKRKGIWKTFFDFRGTWDRVIGGVARNRGVVFKRKRVSSAISHVP